MYVDYYGGILTGEEEADYLFSDDSLTRDTVRYVCMYALSYAY